MSLEIRAIRTEARAEGDEVKQVAGRGIVLDQWEEIFPGFRERIVKGAAKPAEEVKSYFNHDPSQVLSRTTSDPALVIKESDEGIDYVSPIPDTSYGRDLAENLRTRNVQGSSFAFQVNNDRMWEDEEGVMFREISDLTYFEMGPVTDPAYITTSANLASTKQLVEARSKEMRQEKADADPSLEMLKLRQDLAEVEA